VGTREHITAYLAEIGELSDANGMASTQLAAAVGYPGSSVAFAQLLSGMERSGLIRREVRGKRTYRISLGPAQARPAGHLGMSAAMSVAGGAGPEVSGFDYDELARRLLAQCVRQIAEAGGAGEPEGRGAAAAAGPRAADGPPAAGDEERLVEENVRLREQLLAAQRSLALAAERVRRLPVTSDLASSEIVLLKRLLSPWVRAADEDIGLGA
jgi:hypothetical protein